ncbi:arsenate reductase (glutaredoxin) [Rhabdothermincola sp.]|jgi:arsenate reductase|uniref:arsenate reductase (glutaredoxin) n=1 Tax=Rhabdothermincola sp. TaxID=2820405 RepID=UPI002FDF97FC
MAEVVIYHNPRCSNSRRALDVLRERGVEAEVVRYLETPLDRPALERLVAMLVDSPAALVRHDKRFAELGLDPEGYRDPSSVVELLAEHPELMQRPVVVAGGKAIIARPPEEKLAAFLG